MIWSAVLASRVRMVKNRLVSPRGGRAGHAGRWRVLIGVGFFAWFFGVAYAAVWAALSHLQRSGAGMPEAAAAVGAVLTGALAGILVFDLHYAVAALLLDSDLELLRRAPVRPLALMALKLLDSFPRTGALLISLALPACLAFAQVHPVPAWGWAAVLSALLGLWAIPVGAGLAIALVLVRAVPARRAREVLALFSTLMLVALWMANSFLLPRLVDESGDWTRRLVEQLTPSALVQALSPPHWAAEALVASHLGDAGGALGWSALLLLGGALSLGMAGLAASTLLEGALARVAVGESSPRRRVKRLARPPAGFAALLLKDARIFLRDWTVLGDVLAVAVLWTLLPLVVAPVYGADPGSLARFMLVALSVGLGNELGARVVPYEGPALAWVRVAPVRAWRWNLAKLSGAALASLPLLGLAALAIRATLPIQPLPWLEAVSAGVGSVLLSLSVGLWTGWAFGNLDWNDPAAMLTLSGRLIASFLLIAQAGFWLGVLAAGDVLRAELPRGIFLWGPLALATMLSMPPLALAARSANRREWTS